MFLWILLKARARSAGEEARKRKAAQIILLISLTRFTPHGRHRVLRRDTDRDRRTATKHAVGHAIPTDHDAGGRHSVKTAERTRDRLTLAEVCAELGISRSTFYDWRAKQKAPRCITLPNGSLRVRRAELDRWLDAREDAAR